MVLPKCIKIFALFIVLVAIATQDVDARRNILKGRKIMTRTYFHKSAIPAWAVVLLVGVGEIITGVIVFVIMKRLIIDPPLTGSYAPKEEEMVNMI